MKVLRSPGMRQRSSALRGPARAGVLARLRQEARLQQTASERHDGKRREHQERRQVPEVVDRETGQERAR